MSKPTTITVRLTAARARQLLELHKDMVAHRESGADGDNWKLADTVGAVIGQQHRILTARDIAGDPIPPIDHGGD